MKRSKNLLVFSIILGLTSFVGCKKQENKPMSFEKISVSETYSLLEGQDDYVPKLIFDFTFPFDYQDKQTLKKVEQIFVSKCFGEEYKDFSPENAVDEYKKNFLETCKTYEKNLKKDLEEHKAGTEEFCYSCYILEDIWSDTILFQNEDILTFKVQHYSYTGGAHGSSSINAYNILLKDAKILQYEDIFIDGSREKLTELLDQKLMTANNYSSLDELKENYIFSENIAPNNNFIVDDKGVTFIYGEYEIGPYYLGITPIFIPYEDLIPYIKTESPVSKLVDSHSNI